MKTLLASLAAATFLVTAGVASADTAITVGAGWHLFTTALPGENPTQTPFTYASAAPTMVTLTDLFCVGDQYVVKDGSATLGETPPSPIPFNCNYPQFTANPDTALADPNYSHGRFAIAPGTHAIDVIFAGQFGVSSGAAIRVDLMTAADCANGAWAAIISPSFASETDCVAFETVDATPPVIAHQDDVVTDATGPGGATVAYTVTATDNVDPAPVVSCTPSSGSLFAIGTTTVSCTATDAAGNSSSATFAVTVKGAAAQLGDLAAEVVGVGPGRSLAATVSIAQFFLAHGATRATCLTLAIFELEARAQAGKKIPAAQATALIADASRIRSVLSC
jgi:hypothetical protein